MKRPRTIAALATAAGCAAAALFAGALSASAAPAASHHHAICPRWVPHGRTSGKVSLVQWSLNRQAGAAATIYTTRQCAPATALSVRFERYIDHANLLRPMPEGLLLYTVNGKTPPF